MLDWRAKIVQIMGVAVLCLVLRPYAPGFVLLIMTLYAAAILLQVIGAKRR